jgi:hypothetical protein
MATALEVCQVAFRRLNMDQPLISFDASLPFPYNLALDLLQDVCRVLNREIPVHQHMEQSVYVNCNGRGIYSPFEFNPPIEPQKIIAIKFEPPEQNITVLARVGLDIFHALYPAHLTQTGKPTCYTIFGNTVATNVVADADYSMVWYFQQQIIIPTAVNEQISFKDADMSLVTNGVQAYLANAMRLDNADALMAAWRTEMMRYNGFQFKSRDGVMRRARAF